MAAVLWTVLAAPVTAQAPGQPGNAPAPEAAARGSAFDTMVAFAGVSLVLLVVCYPARRY